MHLPADREKPRLISLCDAVSVRPEWPLCGARSQTHVRGNLVAGHGRSVGHLVEDCFEVARARYSKTAAVILRGFDSANFLGNRDIDPIIERDPVFFGQPRSGLLQRCRNLERVGSSLHNPQELPRSHDRNAIRHFGEMADVMGYQMIGAPVDRRLGDDRIVRIPRHGLVDPSVSQPSRRQQPGRAESDEYRFPTAGEPAGSRHAGPRPRIPR
jgi:hypothetical protein